MNYPYGPYPQGFPHPSLPQQGDYQQQPYAATPQKPGGTSAIITGMLALLGGLGGVILVGVFIFSFFITKREERFTTTEGLPILVRILVHLGYGLPLLIGAVALFRRKMIGRRLVVGGCATALLWSTAAFSDMVIGFTGNPTREFVPVIIAIITGFFFPLLTLVLALLPSTAEWLRSKPAEQNPVAPQTPQAYPPFQAYPPYQG